MESGHPFAIELVGKNVVRFFPDLRLVIGEIILPCPEFVLHGLTTLFEPLVALTGKLLVSHFFRHPLRYFQIRKVDATNVWRHSKPHLHLEPLQKMPRWTRTIFRIDVAAGNADNSV